MANPRAAACRSESSVLHIECVWSTAPAPRTRTISTCSRASADGLPAPARHRRAVAVDFEDLVGGEIALRHAARRDRKTQRLATKTALKLPLVPSTQPRASKRRPISTRRREMSRNSAGIADDPAPFNGAASPGPGPTPPSSATRDLSQIPSVCPRGGTDRRRPRARAASSAAGSTADRRARRACVW